MRSRTWWWLAAALALMVAGAVLAGPSGESGSRLRSGAPDGYVALIRFLQANRITVGEADDPAEASGTFVILIDFRDAESEGRLLDWASEGGRLVVADPDSALVEMLGARRAGRIGGPYGTVALPAGCVAPEAAAAGRMVASVEDRGLDPGPGGVSCFPGDEGAFEVVVPWGRGTVVLLGGSSPFTNELLREPDNAALALAIVERGTVLFGPPLPASTATAHRSVWSLLPLRAKAALIALCLALVAYACVRGRRLGRSRPEIPISPIPAGELVLATANLYRAARATRHCGNLLRQATTERVAARLGYPAATPPAEVIRRLEAIGVEPSLAAVLVGPEPATDLDLITLGADVERLRERVERGTR